MKRALMIITAFAILGCATVQDPQTGEVRPPETTEEISPQAKENIKAVAEFTWDRFLDYLIIFQPW
ncbi:MAG: hypothetical protein WC331_10105 [Candidatus Omnitrophota bacterium]|jgi:hypothetical protein